MKSFTAKILVATTALALWVSAAAASNTPVDYVNPRMGNISHMLMPTFPTVHLPNSMMRVYPQRGSATESLMRGLPVFIVNHREVAAFNISAIQSPNPKLERVVTTDYDCEVIKPYYYAVDVDNQRIRAEFAPTEHSAIYSFDFRTNDDAYIILNAQGGELTVDNSTISGWQPTWGGVRVYIYAETNRQPIDKGILNDGRISSSSYGRGDEACAVMKFNSNEKVMLRYAISYISTEQARINLQNEIAEFNLNRIAAEGRNKWNKALGSIRVEGGTEDDMAVFYTSLYRCMERPVDIAEYGKYFCPADHKVHSGDHFYTDDWLWDTYRATHPLRCLIAPQQEVDMINSLLTTAEHSRNKWMPTFPAVSGDSHRMNCNHGVAVVADAMAKGLTGFDANKAYDYCKSAIADKTLAPWSNKPAGYLNEFFREHGYIPALHPGEREFSSEVDGWEKRQAVAVTLGTCYDNWCLSRIAEAIGRTEEADSLANISLNYRKLFNPATSFFHPKDSAGKFIEPFDYRFSGGIGARDYYDENNGWTYRWDVQHNVPDVVNLMGGNEPFCRNLDATFNEWLGCNKYEFCGRLPDQTGNVGQFSMGNEPSMHIPYLYNYAGAPWKTQKRVRELIGLWFRNDLMGMPGDEDGGGLSSFVVFSMMGFYPVTPGKAVYDLGSPFFRKITMTLGNGHKLTIEARNCSAENKYVKSATLNGKPLTEPRFLHDEIAQGGRLVLEMTDRRPLDN